MPGGILDGLRILVRSRMETDQELFELKSKLEKIGARSTESAHSLNRLKDHVEYLLSIGDNAEAEKTAARIVVKAIDSSIVLAEKLEEMITDTRLQHAENIDNVEEIKRLGYQMVSRLANFAQAIKPDTLPLLAAIDPDIQKEFLEYLLKHGQPALVEILSERPGQATELAQLIFEAAGEDQRIALMKMLAKLELDSENSEPTPNVDIEPAGPGD